MQEVCEGQSVMLTSDTFTMRSRDQFLLLKPPAHHGPDKINTLLINHRCAGRREENACKRKFKKKIYQFTFRRFIELMVLLHECPIRPLLWERGMQMIIFIYLYP